MLATIHYSPRISGDPVFMALAATFLSLCIVTLFAWVSAWLNGWPAVRTKSPLAEQRELVARAKAQLMQHAGAQAQDIGPAQLSEASAAGPKDQARLDRRARMATLISEIRNATTPHEGSGRGVTLAGRLSDLARESEVCARRAAELATRAGDLPASGGEAWTARAQDIAGVVELIQSIAEKANLLALQGAVEAAASGERSGAFARAAGEIKSLAGQATGLTDVAATYALTIQAATLAAIETLEMLSLSLDDALPSGATRTV